MAVKCILTGQTPSVLDGVTENVQSQIDNKVNKVTGKGLSTEDYTTTEKTKLSGIEEGAQKNTVTSVAGKTGAVTLAKDDVGLGNVDNTSDESKPISTATQTALDKKQDKLPAGVDINSSQISLNGPYALQSPAIQILNDNNSFLAVSYSATEDSFYGFTAPLEQNPDADGQKPWEIYLATNHADEVDFTTPVSLKNVADPTDPTDAMNLRSTEEVAMKKVAVKGILEGDGTGSIHAAEETEVELVELTADSIGASPKSRILNITLPTASWTGSGPYTQKVTISGGTANTKVDIMFNDTVYQQMVDDQVGYLAIANNSGTFTATASGGKPSADLSIQVECKEVTPPPELKLEGNYRWNKNLTVPGFTDAGKYIDFFQANYPPEYVNTQFKVIRFDKVGSAMTMTWIDEVGGSDRLVNDNIENNGWKINYDTGYITFGTPFTRAENPNFYDWFIQNTTKLT